MHFFNPPPVMDLVELTPSLSTSEETLAFARAFGERLGKTVVVAKDRAGFIVNRLVIPYLCSAIGLFDEGFASREDIDASMTLGMNHPMGPLRLADFIGLDTVLQIAEVLHAEFRDPAYAPPPRLRRMVEAGHARTQERPRLLRLLRRRSAGVAPICRPWQPSARDRRGQRLRCSPARRCSPASTTRACATSPSVHPAARSSTGRRSSEKATPVTACT